MQDAGYRRLPVYGRGEVVAHALVDADLFAELGGYQWHFTGDGTYVGRRVKRADGRWGTLTLHRFIAGVDDGHRPASPRSHNGKGFEVDHENRNRLDNRRSNLRVTTRAGNASNSRARGGSSLHRGVSWDGQRGKWRAYYGKTYLGQFLTEARAAEVAAAHRRTHAPLSID